MKICIYLNLKTKQVSKLHVSMKMYMVHLGVLKETNILLYQLYFSCCTEKIKILFSMSAMFVELISILVNSSIF